MLWMLKETLNPENMSGLPGANTFWLLEIKDSMLYRTPPKNWWQAKTGRVLTVFEWKPFVLLEWLSQREGTDWQQARSDRPRCLFWNNSGWDFVRQAAVAWLMIFFAATCWYGLAIFGTFGQQINNTLVWWPHSDPSDNGNISKVNISKCFTFTLPSPFLKSLGQLWLSW